MNPEITSCAARIAKRSLSAAIDFRNQRNAARRDPELYSVVALCDKYMKGHARDYSRTVNDWNLNPRTGDIR